MSQQTRKVYYNSCADEDVYDMIREVMPTGYEFVSLENDDDEERFKKISDVEVSCN